MLPLVECAGTSAALVALSLGAGAVAQHRPLAAARSPRTVLVSTAPFASFAQDGQEIAWVTIRRRSKQCRSVHIRSLRAGRTSSVQLPPPFGDCSGLWDLALAGRTVLWLDTAGGGNNEAYLDVMTVAAGQRRPRRLERLYLWWDLDSRLPVPIPPLAGAGSVLAYYSEDDAEGGQPKEGAIRRLVGRATRALFPFNRPVGLAVNRGRIALVRQVLRSGDGCGCTNAPDWSTDGRRIAFLEGQFSPQSDATRAEIGVMNADGSGRTVRTHDRLARSALDWSPDGSRFAYSYSKGAAGRTIALVNADGTGAHDLAAGDRPAWSPAGTEIAFSRSEATGSQVFVMDTNGSSVRQLAPGASPAWSPAGTKIAYSNGGALSVMNADGSNQHALTTAGQFADNPDWSPDGQRIVFEASGGIRVVNGDGTGSLALSAGSGDSHPKWSPDGQRVLFASARDDISTVPPSRLELYTMRSDGSDVHPLTFTKQAEWASPGQIRTAGGRRLASFEAAGAPVPAGILPRSGSVALGGNLVAVLSRVEPAGKAQITLFDARTGARKSVVPAPADPLLALAGISGRWVVFQAGKTIRALDARTLGSSVLAVAPATPIGLSVSGRRVAWAENVRGHGRIRALSLPR